MLQSAPAGLMRTELRGFFCGGGGDSGRPSASGSGECFFISRLSVAELCVKVQEKTQDVCAAVKARVVCTGPAMRKESRGSRAVRVLAQFYRGHGIVRDYRRGNAGLQQEFVEGRGERRLARRRHSDRSNKAAPFSVERRRGLFCRRGRHLAVALCRGRAYTGVRPNPGVKAGGGGGVCGR